MQSIRRAGRSGCGRQPMIGAQDLLYDLAVAANAAAAVERLYEPALDAITRGLAVERAAVLLFDGQGVMRFRAWRGLSADYRAAVEGHSPWRAGQPDPQPIVVADVR